MLITFKIIKSLANNSVSTKYTYKVYVIYNINKEHDPTLIETKNIFNIIFIFMKMKYVYFFFEINYIGRV